MNRQLAGVSFALMIGAVAGGRARAAEIASFDVVKDSVQFICDTRAPMPKSDPDMGAWGGPSDANDDQRNWSNGAPIDAAIVTRSDDPSGAYYLRRVVHGGNVYEKLLLTSIESGPEVGDAHKEIPFPAIRSKSVKVYTSDNFRAAARFIPYKPADDVAVVLEVWYVGDIHLDKAHDAHYEMLIETKDGTPFTTCYQPVRNPDAYEEDNANKVYR